MIDTDIIDMAMALAAESVPGLNNQKCNVVNMYKVKFPQEISIRIIISTFNDENKSKHLCQDDTLVELINKYLKNINFKGRVTSIGYNINDK